MAVRGAGAERIFDGLGGGRRHPWIAEAYIDRGTGGAARIAAAANFFGCAAGPLIGGVLAQFAAAPLRLPFFVYLLLLCIVAATTLFAPETVTDRKRLSEVSLKPRLGIPQQIRLRFVSPAVTGFATFALIGFYSALIPSLLRDSLRQTSPAVTGAVVFELFLVAAITILTSGRLASRRATLTALTLLPPSLWLLVLAEAAQSLPLVLLSAAIGGIAGGLGYRGSLEVINRIAPADRRSEVVSSYLIALFAGNSVPVIGIGLLSAATSATFAHVAFAAVITALAGVAMLSGIKFAPDSSDLRRSVT